MIERLLPIQAMQGRTQRATRDCLAYIQGALRGTANLRGIKDIRECEVGDVRSHFIGTRGSGATAFKGKGPMRREYF
jgi:hypothetical protein